MFASSSAAAAPPVAGAGVSSMDAEDAPGFHLTEGEAALVAEAVITEGSSLFKWCVAPSSRVPMRLCGRAPVRWCAGAP